MDVRVTAEYQRRTVLFPSLEGERNGAATLGWSNRETTINYLNQTIIDYRDHSHSKDAP